MSPQARTRHLPPRYSWLVRFLLLTMLALTGTFAGAVSANGAVRFNPPKQYDLVLGDSLAFGYQDARFKSELGTGTYSPATFTGYWQPFAAQLAAIRPGIQTVNFGCPGETTDSFINGGCAFHTAGLALHNDYPATISQLAVAKAFLQEHRGQVGPITISLGANDVNNLLHACLTQYPGNLQAALVCANAGLPSVLSAVNTNLSTTLAQIQAVAPESEIIVLQPYDPFVALIPQTLPSLQALDATLAAAATTARARVADGSSAVTATTVCTLTLICTPQQDIHPSDTGYAMLAQALWAASGYDRILADETGR